jgi:hypothetical protein
LIFVAQDLEEKVGLYSSRSFTVDEILQYRRKFIEKNYIQLLNMYLTGQNLSRSFYWIRKKRKGYDDIWIQASVDKFIGLFENIKKHGFNSNLILMVKKGNRFIRQDGAHRAAIAKVLNYSKLECLVVGPYKELS